MGPADAGLFLGEDDRAASARASRPPDMTLLPVALLARFTGDAYASMKQLPVYLTALTGSAAITLGAVR